MYKPNKSSKAKPAPIVKTNKVTPKAKTAPIVRTNKVTPKAKPTEVEEASKRSPHYAKPTGHFKTYQQKPKSKRKPLAGKTNNQGKASAKVKPTPAKREFVKGAGFVHKAILKFSTEDILSDQEQSLEKDRTEDAQDLKEKLPKVAIKEEIRARTDSGSRHKKKPLPGKGNPKTAKGPSKADPKAKSKTKSKPKAKQKVQPDKEDRIVRDYHYERDWDVTWVSTKWKAPSLGFLQFDLFFSAMLIVRLTNWLMASRRMNIREINMNYYLGIPISLAVHAIVGSFITVIDVWRDRRIVLRLALVISFVSTCVTCWFFYNDYILDDPYIPVDRAVDRWLLVLFALLLPLRIPFWICAIVFDWEFSRESHVYEVYSTESTSPESTELPSSESGIGDPNTPPHIVIDMSKILEGPLIIPPRAPPKPAARPKYVPHQRSEDNMPIPDSEPVPEPDADAASVIAEAEIKSNGLASVKAKATGAGQASVKANAKGTGQASGKAKAKGTGQASGKAKAKGTGQASVKAKAKGTGQASVKAKTKGTGQASVKAKATKQAQGKAKATGRAPGKANAIGQAQGKAKATGRASASVKSKATGPAQVKP